MHLIHYFNSLNESTVLIHLLRLQLVTSSRILYRRRMSCSHLPPVLVGVVDYLNTISWSWDKHTEKERQQNYYSVKKIGMNKQEREM